MPLPPLRARPLLCALALAWPLHTLAALPAGAAAEIVDLQGAGDQRPASATAWSPARTAQALAAGDFVRTREAARMALLFADQTQVRLHQNTVLQVKALATAGQGTTTLRLEAGRAWTKRAARPAARWSCKPPPPPLPSVAPTGTSAWSPTGAHCSPCCRARWSLATPRAR